MSPMRMRGCTGAMLIRSTLGDLQLKSIWTIRYKCVGVCTGAKQKPAACLVPFESLP